MSYQGCSTVLDYNILCDCDDQSLLRRAYNATPTLLQDKSVCLLGSFQNKVNHLHLHRSLHRLRTRNIEFQGQICGYSVSPGINMLELLASVPARDVLISVCPPFPASQGGFGGKPSDEWVKPSAVEFQGGRQP